MKVLWKMGDKIIKLICLHHNYSLVTYAHTLYTTFLSIRFYLKRETLCLLLNFERVMYNWIEWGKCFGVNKLAESEMTITRERENSLSQTPVNFNLN